MKKLRFLFLALPVIACGVFLYIQGFALIPNYDDHPFHDVYVDFRSDKQVAGWKIFDDTEHVGFFTRLGYAYALAKFPDAQSCLEDPSMPLDITSRLNWRAIKRPKQAAVCFFNVAHAFGDRAKVRDWLSNMPEGFHSFYGFEGTMGRGPTQYLFLNLRPMAKRHCLVNLYRCIFIDHQEVAIDMSTEGTVRLLNLNRPKISIN